VFFDEDPDYQLKLKTLITEAVALVKDSDPSIGDLEAIFH